MIKCGKLKGKDDKVAEQCILFTKDGSKALGYFPYSKYGGQKGAKAAAHKREGQIQAFKKKHQSLLDALEAFGAPAVLKYLLDADCPDCEKVVKAHMATWLEKARGEGRGVGGERQGDGGADQCVCPKCGATAAHEKGTPCAEQKCPKCGAAMVGQAAEKSFEVTIEEALTLLEKHDEDEEMELDNIDLSELEAWLKGEEAADVEPEPTEDVEPEPESDVEPEPEPTTEPGPVPEEEQEVDFHTFLLREHAQRRADILAVLGEEVDENG